MATPSTLIAALATALSLSPIYLGLSSVGRLVAVYSGGWPYTFECVKKKHPNESEKILRGKSDESTLNYYYSEGPEQQPKQLEEVSNAS
jgi:hypothetical protein